MKGISLLGLPKVHRIQLECNPADGSSLHESKNAKSLLSPHAVRPRLIRPRDGEFRHTDRSPVENSIHTDGRRHNNTSGIERNSCPEGESASDRWNASFTEAIRRESQGLVDRITALKGADGKWQAAFGTCATTKRVVIRADKSVAVECPEGDSGARGLASFAVW